jgi:D-erythro-7,8-dihydroneopterin triphosphate epimerase
MIEPSLDRIYIRDLRVRCIIGIYPEERRALQEIEINVVMYADLRKAAASDNIEDTVDYKSVKKAIAAHVEVSQCLLVERLAQEIADICLAVRGVERVQVTVDKPGALRFVRSVAVEITRSKG